MERMVAKMKRRPGLSAKHCSLSITKDNNLKYNPWLQRLLAMRKELETYYLTWGSEDEIFKFKTANISKVVV